MDIGWTVGSVNADTVIVVVTDDGSIDGSPVDGTVYTADLSFIGGGSDIGVNDKVVYAGPVSGSPITVTNLTKGTTYDVAVFAYAGAGAGVINYQQEGPVQRHLEQQLIMLMDLH
jgi:hypothetical protein